MGPAWLRWRNCEMSGQAGYRSRSLGSNATERERDESGLALPERDRNFLPISGCLTCGRQEAAMSNFTEGRELGFHRL
jgi:hypothetical protein